MPFTGETTQFDDVLMKHGIITKEQALLAKGMDVESVAEILVKDKLQKMGFFDDPEIDYQDSAFDSASSSSSSSSSSGIATKKASEQSRRAAAEAAGSLEELEELGEEALADDSFLESYRAKRKEQLKARQAKSQFGTANGVKEISKADWMIEVNRASETHWVLCLLHEDHIAASSLLDALFARFAAKFTDIKCVKIKSRSAVENFPERNVPALFAYRHGEMKHQVCENTTVPSRADG